MITVKIGQRGQITVPRIIRQKLELKEGDSLAFILQDDQVYIKPITQTLLDLRGSIPVKAPQNFDEIRKQVISSRGKRIKDGE
jgi:AbrB family looped-hinge helix DNA binding protein